MTYLFKSKNKSKVIIVINFLNVNKKEAGTGLLSSVAFNNFFISVTKS